MFNYIVGNKPIVDLAEKCDFVFLIYILVGSIIKVTLINS